MKTPDPKLSKSRFFPMAIALLGAAMAVSTASAATTSWTNAGNSTWETAGNWSGGAPADNDTAFLAGNTGRTITISGTTAAIASLQSTNTNNSAWTITGGTLAFANGGSLVTGNAGNNGTITIDSLISATNLSVTGSRLRFNNASNAIAGTLSLGTNTRVIFNTPATAGSASLFLAKGAQAQIGAGTFTNAITLADTGAGVFAFNIANKTLEIAGTVSESGGARDATFSTLNDSGTILISGDNTYTGNTQIGRSSAASDTTIRITSGTAFGSAAKAANVTFLTAAGTGAQTLEIAGGITVSNRNLTLYGAGIGSKGSLYNAAGDNTWAGNIDLGITNNATIGVTNGTSLTVTGEISGSVTGGFIKAGAGTLILTGSNSFTSGTAVSAGTLELKAASGSALGATASVAVGTGATLLLSESHQIKDTAAITLSGGTITRGAGVSETMGDLTLTAASTLDYGTGAAGTLQFGTYTPSSLLTVNNFFFGNKLVFGSQLSEGDLSSKFDFGSYEFTTNWSGGLFTITAVPEPSAYAAAAALLGLLLWPSRRRLLKDTQSLLGFRRPAKEPRAQRA